MDNDDLWGPPLVVQDDTFRKHTLRSCEFWFDCRTDVLEENFQYERDCVQVWRLLNEKKKDAEIHELDKDSVSVSPRNDMASCRSGEMHDIGSSDSDKALSVVPLDADTSSAKSALDEEDNTSSISDAQTIETRDSSNGTEEIDAVTKSKPKETALYDPPTVEVAEDAETTSSPVLASKIEEAEEHSCSSLVTIQVFDPIKQALENKSSSAVSSENIGATSLLDTGEKVREKANATNEDGEALDDDREQSNSLQDIVFASEPFTTESLLELCDEPDKSREIACDEKSKKSHLEAVRAVVKDELIINLFNEARRKAESNNTQLNTGLVLTKKRQRDSKGMNTSFVRNTKQNVRGEAGEINTAAIKNSAQSTPEIIRGSSASTRLSLLELEDGSSQRDEHIVNDSVIPLSTSELKKKTGKELRSISKALKVTHYYKLKKEDLVQQLTMQLKTS